MPIAHIQNTTSHAISRSQLSDAQFHQFAMMIYRRTGIRVAPTKKLLLSNRLRRRMRETQIAEFGDYFRHLRRLDEADPEWDAFFQEITTHESYLFRDPTQWTWFRDVFLAGRVAAARHGKAHKSLRLWSAACSTGDEPVTAACCIAATLHDLAQWHVHILCTDIACGSIERAEKAEFGERAMRFVPEGMRRRFFAKAAHAAIWRPRPVITDMLTFQQHNLMKPLGGRPFDLVMLRNVLMYFDDASKETVLQHVRKVIPPGGVLMVGCTEGLAHMLRDFRRLGVGLFQKAV